VPNYLSTLKNIADPKHTALVIVDMQNDLVRLEGAAASKAGRPIEHVLEVLPNIEALLVSARKAGVYPVHVQYTTPKDYSSLSEPWLEARSRARYGMLDFCVEGTWGHQICDELAPRDGEPCVVKYRYSGFPGTNLDMLLRARRLKTVVVCGVSTNVCVESTARDAFSNDYYVVLPSNACASWDRRLHDASLESAAARYATVCDVDELTHMWSRVTTTAGGVR